MNSHTVSRCRFLIFVIFGFFYVESYSQDVISLEQTFETRSQIMLEKYIDEQNRNRFSSDNDTIDQVSTVIQSFLDLACADALHGYRINNLGVTESKFVILPSTIKLSYAITLDTPQVIKMNLINEGFEARVRADDDYNKIIIENFYKFPKHLILSDEIVNYYLPQTQKISNCKLVILDESVLHAVNRFLKSSSPIEHREKADFISKQIKLYPTIIQDRQESRYNIHFKEVIFDTSMHEAILIFDTFRKGGNASFERTGNKWHLVNAYTQWQQ